MDKAAIARDIVLELIRKSGVREWETPESVQAIQQAAVEMAEYIWSNTEAIVANKILLTEMDGTPKQIVFADHATDFNPTANNDLRKSTDGSQELDVQLDLTGLADGSARQSAKVDLGENRAAAYLVRAAFEIAATPTAGEVIELYWAPSHHGTAATGNPANITGSDAAYAGYSSNLAASVKQLQFIGHFVCTVQASGTIQVAVCGYLEPDERYGSLVVKNESGAALHSDAVEMSVVFDPVVSELQT